MHCRRVEKSIMDYADGGLSPSRREEISRHLDSCDDCSALAGKLSLSTSALGSLDPVEMTGEASARVLAAIRRGETSAEHGGGFFRSPRVIATAGIATAVLIALAIVVGVYTGGGPGTTEKAAPGSATTLDTITGTDSGRAVEEAEVQGGAQAPVASLVMPVAAVTSNDYDESSMKAMAEELDVKKEFAERYTMTDAVNMKGAFVEKLADEFSERGGDGALLEAMILFVQTTEPVLLPCYAEKALYAGQTVYIVALCGPPRSGASGKLTRTEFWAFSPEKFLENPDVSLLWWGQSQ